MNETLQVIKSRRSIRKFKTEQIADTDLQQIMEAALYAPNAINQQKWHFSVIQNQELLTRMVEIIKENIFNSGNEFLAKQANNPAYNTFYHAPTVVMIFGAEKGIAIEQDCALAAQNIALAAEALNIGSCYMTSPGLLFASERGNQLRGEMGIPEGYKYVCTLALGYKDGDNPPAPVRNLDVINYIKA